ncbi:MAG: patatin-like phospholipase family protein [Planctomycetota bacterium]
MTRKKIAIACQGGGSQTAFTAGVLKSFFEANVHEKRQIVSLSGTSGGAVCASLAWHGLLRAAKGDKSPIQDRLTSFWNELSAQFTSEISLDAVLTQWMRVIDKGVWPRFEISPASSISQWALDYTRNLLPRHEFTDLKLMLEKHIDFEALRNLVEPHSPVLLVGAAEVLTGELKVFNTREEPLCVEAILASAAVPSLFPAVKIGENYYWDGLFSDNPPLKELIRPRMVGGENVPDEIWVIQINSDRCKSVPTSPCEIIDRRNQMIGNLSLRQSLEYVELVNIFLRENILTEEVLHRLGVTLHAPIDVHFVRMSEQLQDSLDYVSKLSREPTHITRLIEDGEKQGSEFLHLLGL